MEFDTTLKELPLSNPTRLFEQLSGDKVEAWLNIEQPSVKMRRIDLAARLKSGRILHIEIQVGDDPEMPWRMLEYYAHLRRTYGQEPWQIVLYVGKKKPRRTAYIREQRLRFSYDVIYIRELDGRPLLDSDSIADNLIAILCDIDDVITASRHIIEKLLTLPEKQAIDEALKLIILSKLRGAEKIVTEEVNKRMKITREYLIGIPVIGDLMLSGEEQAETRGERKVLTKQLEARFGLLPAWAKKHLSSADVRKLEHWSLQLLTAKSLKEALK